MATGMIAGIFNAQLAFRNSDGYPVGQETAPDAASNGTITSAYRIPHPVSVALPVATTAIATDLGGQRIRGQRVLGKSDLGTGTMVLSEFDETFNAYITGSSVDTTTASGVSQTTENVNIQSPPQFVMLLSVTFTNASGVNEYLTYILHNVQITKQSEGSSQDGGVNPNPLEYEVVVRTSSVTGYGRSYANTSLNADEDSDTFSRIRALKQYALTTFIDDGADTDIDMGFLPADSDVDGAKNIFSSNGADDKANVTALSTTTGTATVSSGSAGDVRVFFYQTDFEALP